MRCLKCGAVEPGDSTTVGWVCGGCRGVNWRATQKELDDMIPTFHGPVFPCENCKTLRAELAALKKRTYDVLFAYEEFHGCPKDDSEDDDAPCAFCDLLADCKLEDRA